MKFMEIVEKLQKDNPGYVVLVRCGIFFNSIGKDAVFMQEKFGLGTICAKPNICKNGIAVSSIQKMLPRLYRIYDRSNNKNTKNGKI